MRTHIGGLAVEITRPESAKFHHPLLLLHGFWTGSWIWEPLANYLAHRGWESWAPSTVGVGGEAERTRALDAVVNALRTPPIVIAHDVGLLAVRAFAARVPPPAVVAIAPVVPSTSATGGGGIFAWPQFWRARLVGASVPPPRGAGARAFLGDAVAMRDRLRADSAEFFRAVATGAVRLPPRLELPGLVLGGSRDSIAPDRVVRDVAVRLGWEHRTLPNRGHFAMLEAGWEVLADDLHRWIVRTLGADLLALLDEDPL